VDQLHRPLAGGGGHLKPEESFVWTCPPILTPGEMNLRP